MMMVVVVNIDYILNGCVQGLVETNLMCHFQSFFYKWQNVYNI